MNFKQFLEMPITNFQLMGQWGPDAKRGYGYNAKDTGILENPKAVEKIHRSWSNSKNDFELYFVRSFKASKKVEIGEVKPEWIKEHLDIEIPAKENAITVVFTNNTGAEKIPMTAWAMAHRLGHAIRLDKTFETYMRQEVSKDFREILLHVYGIEDNYAKKPWEAGPSEYATMEKYKKALFYEVGKMKSARERNLRNSDEFVHELVAQYIVTGKIEFNDLPSALIVDKRMAWGKPYFNLKRFVSKEVQVEYNETLHNNAQKYEYNLDSIFSGLEGKIFVM